MKNIFKFLILILVLSPMLKSCETAEMDLLTSPNALSPEQADPNFLYNKVQVDYVDNIADFNQQGAELSRISYMFGRNYQATFSSITLQTAWGRFYNRMLPDIANIEKLNSDDRDLSYVLGTSKILQAHSMMLFVDYFGDIVFSEANQPVDFPSPNLDSSSDVYNAAFNLLDEAISMLQNTSGVGDATDLFYNGDASKWIKLANTLKMRFYLTQGNYQEVLNLTNFISSADDDFQFQYGTKETNPDTRHPWYSVNYRSDGAGDYQSNWLMKLMLSDLGPTSDPRRRYYFYRQTWITPGNYSYFEDVNGVFGPPGNVYMNTSGPDAETLDCSIEAVPTHLEFTPDEDIWCSLPNGYWGRTHGNDDGTPPDEFLRTAPGVYPAGGSFDWRTDYFPYVGDSPNATWGQKVAQGAGGGGNGIQPIILSSYVQFWLAEANLQLGNLGAAATNMQNGLSISIDKVTSFASLDPTADMTNAPSATDISNFIALKVNDFNNAPATSALDANGYPTALDKLDVLGEQFFVTMFGGGADAYNFIRRTGHPRTLARSVDPNPGDFPRTFLYPASESTSNPNITQKPNLGTLTFWDSGIVNPAN